MEQHTLLHSAHVRFCSESRQATSRICRLHQAGTRPACVPPSEDAPPSNRRAIGTWQPHRLPLAHGDHHIATSPITRDASGPCLDRARRDGRRTAIVGSLRRTKAAPCRASRQPHRLPSAHGDHHIATSPTTRDASGPCLDRARREGRRTAIVGSLRRTKAAPCRAHSRHRMTTALLLLPCRPYGDLRKVAECQAARRTSDPCHGSQCQDDRRTVVVSTTT